MKFISILFLSLSMHTVIYAATRGDVKIIEASENIRYISQKMVKDYFFLYKDPKKNKIKIELENILEKLTINLREIAITTKDTDTKNILEFLAYNKDQIRDIFATQANKENAALMLDYSETLLEGADAIASAHRYDFTDEEKMLMTAKTIEYLLERISKYYMAFNIGFNTHNNKEQLYKVINDIEENMAKINIYTYPYDLQKDQLEMNIVWQEIKVYFKESEILFIPYLLLSSTAYLESIVKRIEIYHSKNQ